MVENAVKDNANAPFSCLFNQRNKRLFTTEHLVNGHIVARIVFVVGICLKNWAQINNLCSKTFKVIKFVLNTLKISTKEHIIFKLIALIFRILGNTVVPIVIHNHVITIIGFNFTLCKSVNKNVIHNSLSKPFLCLKIILINKQRKL